QLAVSPSLSVGVDLLTALFNDEDPAIRAAALETYMRRVYRAHKILDISVDTSGEEMSVDWSFRFRDTAPADSPIRYGHLSVLPDIASLTEAKVAELAKIIQGVKDADTGKSTDGEAVNVLHVALMEV
ncbi:unnamed protein product, partial [Hapterophycus canaliculatus]